MYKIISSPPINLKKNNFIFSQYKSLSAQLEQDIFYFINSIREKPSKLIPYLSQNNIPIDLEIEQVINYIHNLSVQNMSFQPLIQNKELTKISNDLLNYIINLKTNKRRIKYDLMENQTINLRKRASPNIKIKGKYYEGIVLESTNLIEIISYILRDSKGRNVLFNDKIKYIGIACGKIENLNEVYDDNNNICKICTIIDLVQDLEVNNIIDVEEDLFINKSNYNIKEKRERNVYFLPKSLSYDKFIKKNIKRKKNNKDIIISKGNTYDNVRLNVNKNNSPILNNKEKLTYDQYIIEKSKTPNISSSKSNTKSQKIFSNIKTQNNTFLNKLYKNNSFYSSKNAKNNEEKIQSKKELDNKSKSNTKSSVSFSKRKTRKKLNPEEKIRLLKQINQESRDKSKKKKSAIKADEDNKSVSFTNQKNNISNDASFSEIISLDNDKKLKEPKININELKKELKKELKEELKAELENKINNDNKKLKVPLLNFSNQNEKMNNSNNDNKNDLYNKNRETKGLDNNNTNRSINSIDIFLPPNKNITAIDNDIIPGLININSNILNKNKTNNNKKENVIIKKFLKLNGIKNLHKENKTPVNLRKYDYEYNYNYKNNSPKIRNNNYIYHKIPFSNNNIYCNKITKKNGIFNNIQEKKIIRNFKNINILNPSYQSPRPSHKESHITFKKMIVKNINNDIPNIQKTGINKIIKIPKKIINNLNYIDNNSIIINNKTNNIVYIKQTSPYKMKSFEMNNIYKKK